ncbi:hypothetical protein [Rhizobium leguminosarum]|nr:hypothetical protein [Rhizobium leguminosarum]
MDVLFRFWWLEATSANTESAAYLPECSFTEAASISDAAANTQFP